MHFLRSLSNRNVVMRKRNKINARDVKGRERRVEVEHVTMEKRK